MLDGCLHKFRCLVVLLHFLATIKITSILSANMHAIVVFLFLTSWLCFPCKRRLGFPPGFEFQASPPSPKMLRFHHTSACLEVSRCFTCYDRPRMSNTTNFWTAHLFDKTGNLESVIEAWIVLFCHTKHGECMLCFGGHILQMPLQHS